MGHQRDAVVVALGGSFLVGPDGVEEAFVRDLAAVLERVGAERDVYAVVGGGAVARRYIRAARELGADETSLDDMGIAVTRLNARLLIAALPGAYPRPAEDFHEALQGIRAHHPFVIMGGTHAGHTTDAVAAMLAERARATRLVIATNVDGVYTADPRTDPAAERLARVAPARLVEIVTTGVAEAGGSGVVDPLAARLIARSRIPAAVVKGTELKDLEAALTGRDDFHGTLVTEDA